MRILVLNGPNLNLLGVREPGLYGTVDYEGLVELIRAECERLGIEAEFYQSNHEGDLVDAIQNARGRCDGLVLNPGAYTHTSIALLDCIRSITTPVIEVHISNVHAREEFRHKSMISSACLGVIAGFGLNSYKLAIEAVIG